jgi:hypothetical protein
VAVESPLQEEAKAPRSHPIEKAVHDPRKNEPDIRPGQQAEPKGI